MIKSFAAHKLQNTLIIAIAAISIALIGWYWYMASHPLANPTFGFQLYVPTQLPKGVNITERQINVSYNGEGKQYDLSAKMNFRTKDWLYSIIEFKYDAKRIPGTDIITAQDSYDPDDSNTTCQQRTAPDARSYRLCHWHDFSEVSVYEIKFVIDGTYIVARMPSKIDHIIPVEELDAYVGSFTKSSGEGFKIHSAWGFGIIPTSIH